MAIQDFLLYCTEGCKKLADNGVIGETQKGKDCNVEYFVEDYEAYRKACCKGASCRLNLSSDPLEIIPVVLT